ncbi:MAG: hypothetical protein FWD26_03720 [Treponema sp.]|nr:hypothetical protein [Treponema sp.]
MVKIIVIVALFAVLGIGLGILFNKLVIKKFPENERKLGYVNTIIVFMITAAALAGIVQAKILGDAMLNDYSASIKQYINDNHSNIGFVRNGLDLSGNREAAVINSALTDIKAILPSYIDIGVSRGIYDFASNMVINQMQKSLLAMHPGNMKVVDSFKDENNFLTVTSILNGMKKSITNILNIVLLVIASIFIIIFVTYVIKSLVAAAKIKPESSGTA